MEKCYERSGYTIPVAFKEGIITIGGSRALSLYLSNAGRGRTSDLVNDIRKDYLRYFNKELKISDRSMAVEIRGHVYASRSAKWLRARFKFAWCRQLANWISKRSDFIDCGERQFDHNRLLWDVLAIFYN